MRDSRSDRADATRTRAQILAVLDAVHRQKDRAYGDAWRRRGEVLGIFANVARKVDRLALAMREKEPSPVETIADTAADLAIYTAKYLTWLAEVYPREFEGVHPSAQAAKSARMGPDGLRHVLKYLDSWELAEGTSMPVDAQDAWSRVAKSFARLEGGLMAQAENRPSEELRPGEKTESAWALLDGSVWLLVRICESDPAQLEALRRVAAPMGVP